MTRKLLLQMGALPTGGLRRWRCSSIQPCRLNGMSWDMVASSRWGGGRSVLECNAGLGQEQPTALCYNRRKRPRSIRAEGANPMSENVPTAEILKQAFKAFKKRLKVTQLDSDSQLRGRALSGGSTPIVAMSPPEQVPKAVW